MIYTTVTLSVENNECKYNKQVLLYRGDKNVEIRFEIKDSRFTVLNSTYVQMMIKRPSATSIFSDISKIEDNTFVLVITREMIDELSEIGEYSYQIRLFDDTQASRATLPPAINGILIEDPLTSEDELNVVDVARVGYAMVSEEDEEKEYFDENGSYNETIWETGDTITKGKLNKIEGAIGTVNSKIGNIDLSSYAEKTELPTKTSQLTNDSDFLTSIPSEYVTESELTAKGYATQSYVNNAIDNVDTMEISNTQPTDDNVTVWLNPIGTGEISTSEINDNVSSASTTWSSSKIKEYVDQKAIDASTNISYDSANECLNINVSIVTYDEQNEKLQIG